MPALGYQSRHITMKTHAHCSPFISGLASSLFISHLHSLFIFVLAPKQSNSKTLHHCRLLENIPCSSFSAFFFLVLNWGDGCALDLPYEIKSIVAVNNYFYACVSCGSARLNRDNI